ncbi:hypothetical protein SAMN06298216_0616 [Spirosomataceae bacterium TFI 002]|nr:hypothetical protein SAMN06298216_0616 [Spirosomataceae bacterium TFI 002]
MKHEWRKAEKSIYIPKAKPEVIDVPEYQFAVISGEGNPNSPAFQEHIVALYTISYALKMGLKKREDKPTNYVDWTVYPLEGVWDLNEKGRQNYKGKINKDDLVFDLMIRQPDFISNDFFHEMLEFAKKKKPHKLLDKLEFKKIKEGRCIQMLHIGSYDNESASFEQMEAFAGSQNLVRKSKIHREIYLSDFRKVAEEKLKTTLRFQLEN